MDKCELNVVGFTEVWWPGKGETVSGIYRMFYSGGVKAEKSVAIVLRNDIVGHGLTMGTMSLKALPVYSSK